jgi:hypothetical protein
MFMLARNKIGIGFERRPPYILRTGRRDAEMTPGDTYRK